MTRYLVTGGAGFIGSHIVETLHKIDPSAEIRVLDNLSTGHLHNLELLLPHIEFLDGDLCDPACLKEAVAGVDVIFHLAAQVSVPKSMLDPLTTHQINATGTLQLLEAAHQAKVRRVVFSSTSAIYGDEPTLPKVETMAPRVKSPYAVAKLAGEGYCQYFTDYHGLETCCLRYFNVYGPRQDPSSPYSGVISIMVDKLSSGEEVTIFGDGEQTRDFVYVADVVAANLAAAAKPKAVGKIFNIGTGKTTSLNQLYQTIAQVLGKTAQPIYGPPRAGDIIHSWTDPTQAKEHLGWDAKTSLPEGLQAVVSYKSNKR